MRRICAWVLLGATLTLVAGCGPLRRFGYGGFFRDSWQQPERVIESLAIVPGARVADLGAGGGYFTWHLAAAVGESGRVYAVDVDADMTSYIEEESREKGLANVQAILAEYDDPLIPGDGVDLIFLCNTYHHLEDQKEYFRRAAKYLRPGGRVAVIEPSGEGWFQGLFPHFVAPEVVRSEMEAAGYERVEDFDFLEHQSFQVFARASE
jgi:ubiquinone/menaquinone biosynthesis C-methylase UbiE